MAAIRYGVVLHAICVLSNHWHAVVTDPDARLPAFLQWVHEYIAKCVNASYGRYENMWASEQTSVVRLEGDEDFLNKIVYCLANPVSAGLVAHGDKWPGVRSSPMDLSGASYEVPRPPIYFRADGPMATASVLRFERPSIYNELSDDALAERVAELVAEQEALVRDTHAREGVGFLGVDDILKQKPSNNPDDVGRLRKISPRVAAKNRGPRVAALRRLKWFVDAYRDALRMWREGARDIVFPLGTYAMRVHHGVACPSAQSP